MEHELLCLISRLTDHAFNHDQRGNFMPPQSPKPLTLLTAVLFIICIAWPFSAHVEAKGRKGKSASRSKSSKRSSARRSHRRSRKAARAQAENEVAVIPGNYPIAPDRIEVIESGSASAPKLSRYLNPPLPPSRAPRETADADPTLLTKRNGLKIDEPRALQIQQALKQRGFYAGEMTGVYDLDTFEAMRRFQTQEKIPATGYPTAHALKRLGL
jgi:Putative peptidoglycan binding domain